MLNIFALLKNNFVRFLVVCLSLWEVCRVNNTVHIILNWIWKILQKKNLPPLTDIQKVYEKVDASYYPSLLSHPFLAPSLCRWVSRWSVWWEQGCRVWMILNHSHYTTTEREQMSAKASLIWARAQEQRAALFQTAYIRCISSYLEIFNNLKSIIKM